MRDVELHLPETTVSTGGRWVLGAVAEKADTGLDLTIVNERARPFATRITEAKFECDHCKQTRARNTVLVVLDTANEDGFLTLGTECAKNYVGQIDRDLKTLGFQSVVELIIREESWEADSHGGSVLRSWDFVTAFLVAAAVIRTHGYVSRWSKNDFGDSTENANCSRNLAYWFLTGTPSPTVVITDADREQARKVVEWLAAKNPADLHDALRSAYDTLAVELVSEKKLGSVCWAVEAYNREQAEAARQARLAAIPQGTAPSGRVQVKGEVVSVKEYPGFGRYDPPTVKILVFVTSPAAHAKTKVFVTAGAWLEGDPVKGQEVEFVATFEPSPSDPLFAKGTRPSAPKAPKASKAKRLTA